jgi:hypothetical protein
LSGSKIWGVTRRAVLGAPLVLAVPALAAETSLADDVATFVGFGEHRAGTVGERKTVRWLNQRLSRLGYQTEQQKVPIRTLLEPGGHLLIEGKRTELFPQWLPPASAIGRTIKAPLLPLDAPAGAASIRLLRTPGRLSANWIEPLAAHVEEAKAKGAKALVMAINDPSDDLFVCNQHHPEPLPLPVMLAARRKLVGLTQQMGRDAELRVSGKLADTHAVNILGRKTGKGPMIVMSTPLTGWFQCGGERGPGIALWLKMARLLARQDRPVLMLGTGSHEIGHLGMEHALAHGAPTPAEVGLWVHFGASLAATKLDERYGYKTGQYLVGTDMTAALARGKLGGVMPIYVPGTAQTLGEAGQVIGAGHTRFIGISGQFPTFHTPLDKGEAIDFAQLQRIASAAEGLIMEASAPGN